MQRRQLDIIALTVLVLSLLAVLSPRPSAAQSPGGTPTLNPEQILDEAQKAAKDANDASNSASQAMNAVGTILNLIQVGGLAVTVLTGAAAVFGLFSTNQYRQKMEAEIAALSQRLNEEKDKLAQEKDLALQEMIQARVDLAAQRTQLNAEIAQIRTGVHNSGRAVALMQLGEQQLEFKNIKGALQLYKQAYDLDNDNPAINYFLGELYLHERQLDTGRYHLDRAKAAGKDYAPIEAAYGYALRLQGEQERDLNRRDMLYAEAEAQFRRAIAIDDNVLNLLRESVHGWLGGLYKRQRRYDKAIESYERAHAVTPQSSYPVINLASLHYTQGRVAVAQDYFRRSEANANYKLDRNPSDYWALLNRMVARLALDKTDDALSDFHDLRTRYSISGKPLQAILGDMERLKESPHPPRGIDQLMSELKVAVGSDGLA